MSGPGEAFSAKLVGLNGDAALFLSGELDMATAPQLTEALDPLIARGPHEIVVDLSALSFIDSSGIAALVEAQHRLGAQERRLSIHGAQRGAVRVFEIAGLVDYLHVQTAHVEDSSV
jgi:anti-sigma B factor antagonist